MSHASSGGDRSQAGARRWSRIAGRPRDTDGRKAWQIEWDDGQTPVSSLAVLDGLLDGLQQRYGGGRPVIVVVQAPDGDSLAVAVGGELSMLNYIEASQDPPYLTAVGPLEGQGVVAFSYIGDWTEVPLRNAIPIALARDAVRHFFKTGRLLDSLVWEED